jgi:hypothetical protein
MARDLGLRVKGYELGVKVLRVKVQGLRVKG